jgi:HD-GYP domain-containing protein (c-di-GMP phosphodiesterase class II)
MAQVILIESNKTMKDLISVNLTTYLGVDVIHRKTAKDAISLLDILPSIDLIITNAKIDREDSANVLNEYLIKNNLEINLIVLGGEVSSPTSHTLSIADDKDWLKVVSFTANIFGITEETLARRIVPDYVPVPVRYFLNLESVNCDVFIRIKKSPIEYQFVKRIHHGDSFSKESIMAYVKQNLTHFFIPKDSYKNFAIFLSNLLVAKIEAADNNLIEKIDLMGEAYVMATREILHLGFNSEIVQLSDLIIENMVKSFGKSPEMSSLLHKVINSKTGLLYQRSYMVSVVASEMMKNLRMENKKDSEKLAFAAFFHDILLTEHEHLSKINSLEDLEKAKLSEKEWDLVFNHANDAALLIKGHPESPIGADEIIRQHHGAANGKGFSNAIESLPDLSKIFIVAHHFVLELMKFKENGGEPRPITEDLFRRYPSSDMAPIIRSLETTLRKKKTA